MGADGDPVPLKGHPRTGALPHLHPPLAHRAKSSSWKVSISAGREADRGREGG